MIDKRMVGQPGKYLQPLLEPLSFPESCQEQALFMAARV